MNDEGEFASANTTTRVVGSIEPYTVSLESHRLKLPTSDIMTIDDTTVLQIIRGLHDSRLTLLYPYKPILSFAMAGLVGLILPLTCFSPKAETMRFTALVVATSFAYSTAAMPAKLAVESQSFNSVGAATDNVQGIVSGTAVGGFRMPSAGIEAYSPSLPPVLSAKSVVYQSTLTSDIPSVSPQTSQVVVSPTSFAISCPPTPSTVIPMLTFVNPNATASATVLVPFCTNGSMKRVRGHAGGMLGLVFVYAVLQGV